MKLLFFSHSDLVACLMSCSLALTLKGSIHHNLLNTQAATLCALFSLHEGKVEASTPSTLQATFDHL